MSGAPVMPARLWPRLRGKEPVVVAAVAACALLASPALLPAARGGSSELRLAAPERLEGSGRSAAEEGAAVSPQAAGPVARPGAEASRDGDDERELASLEARARRLEVLLERDRSRRDALVRKLAASPGQSPLERIVSYWQRRSSRTELERVVARLQRVQGRLLETRARRAALLEGASDREWARLEALVSEAESSWRAGSEPLAVQNAIEELARGSAFTVERYRALVSRLARVNAILRDGEARQEQRAADRAAVPRAASRNAPSEFLGLAERGEALELGDHAAGSRENDLAAWRALRDRLASEIVATASEITRRNRRT